MRITPDLLPLARQLESVHPDPQNSRAHPPRSLKVLMAALQDHGQQKPLVVTEAGLILAGNGTWQAAKALGWTEIACVTFRGTAAQARAYQVADNRSAELAEWSEERLAAELEAITTADIALDRLGFTGEELALLLKPRDWTPPAVDPDFYLNPYIMTAEEWARVAPVFETLRADVGDPRPSDGRCLELVAADYLAGA